MGAPWLLWLEVAAILGWAEAASRRLILAAASAGSLGAAIAAALGASLPVQLLTVAAVSGTGLCLRRPLLKPYLRAIIKRQRLVGMARVTEQIEGLRGQIRYGGLSWPAYSPGRVIPTGTRVKISSLHDDVAWVHAAQPQQAPKDRLLTGSSPAASA